MKIIKMKGKISLFRKMETDKAIFYQQKKETEIETEEGEKIRFFKIKPIIRER